MTIMIMGTLFFAGSLFGSYPSMKVHITQPWMGVIFGLKFYTIRGSQQLVSRQKYFLSALSITSTEFLNRSIVEGLQGSVPSGMKYFFPRF